MDDQMGAGYKSGFVFSGLPGTALGEHLELTTASRPLSRDPGVRGRANKGPSANMCL